MFFYFLILGAFIGAAAAQRKKFNIALGAICGAWLGPFAVFLYLVKGNLVNCPQCDKKISNKAKVCPYCTHSMTAAVLAKTVERTPPAFLPEQPKKVRTQGTDYLKITQDILKGSTLSDQTIIAISVAAETENLKALEQALGDEDFSWPWFDKTKAAFDAAEVWPDLAGWSWFEGDPDPLETPNETKKRRRAKRVLLISSIQTRFYNTQRHEQLAMMVIDMGCTVTLVINDPAVDVVVRNYHFDPDDSKNVPPFFPGDTTSLKSNSPRKQSVS